MYGTEQKTPWRDYLPRQDDDVARVLEMEIGMYLV